MTLQDLHKTRQHSYGLVFFDEKIFVDLLLVSCELVFQWIPVCSRFSLGIEVSLALFVLISDQNQ